jgi:hypothetical protein
MVADFFSCFITSRKTANTKVLMIASKIATVVFLLFRRLDARVSNERAPSGSITEARIFFND